MRVRSTWAVNTRVHGSLGRKRHANKIFCSCHSRLGPRFQCGSGSSFWTLAGSVLDGTYLKLFHSQQVAPCQLSLSKSLTCADVFVIVKCSSTTNNSRCLMIVPWIYTDSLLVNIELLYFTRRNGKKRNGMIVKEEIYSLLNEKCVLCETKKCVVSWCL